MPQIGSQPSQYIAHVEKVREDTRKLQNTAEELHQAAVNERVKKENLLKDGLRITIGFTKRNRHCFIAYYDYAIGMRVVVEREAHFLRLEPWRDWKKKHSVVKQFDCSLDLSKCLRILSHTMMQGFQYKRTIVCMLQNAKLADHLDPEKSTINDLYEYLEVNDLFKEANPAEYLEDIVDYE